MHRKRLLTAAVFLPLVYLYVMRLRPEFYLLLLIAFAVAALREYYVMTSVSGIVRVAGLAWGAALPAIYFYAPGRLLDAFVLTVLSLGAIRLFSRRDTTGSIRAAGDAVFGLLYIPVLLLCQLDMVRRDPAWIVLLFASVWAADSMAYYIGKGFGKRKLYVEVSPNKTVAGAFGSLAGGCGGAVIVGSLLLPSLPLVHAALLGIAVGLTTIVGDLVESMFKRDAGVKDSGGIIPGHGGVLDKLDGVLFAGPVFYWVGRLLGVFG